MIARRAGIVQDVEQDVDLPVVGPGDDHVVLADRTGDEVAGVRDLVLVPDDQPGPRRRGRSPRRLADSSSGRIGTVVRTPTSS